MVTCIVSQVRLPPAMTDLQLPSELLLKILRVLERVEERLERLERPDKHSERPENLDPLYPPERRPYVQNHWDYDEHIPSQAPAKETFANGALTKHHPHTATIPYNDWSMNSYNSHFEGEVLSMLKSHLGDYWRVPKDNRLPLVAFKSTLDIENCWGPQVALHSAARPNIEVRLDLLRRFDAEHRIEKGNDFLVIDYDLVNNTRLYRIGDSAIGSDLMVDSLQQDNAPWSRLM